ncbi:NAD(P)-binding domain-containing protein [Streptomyces chengmaiensis]|uniref:NAD(P)-binding domain-containing protein n=1 Tax=Streptomyces chengmaiensis TaxID=3040919 RepID=UPI002961F42B|nr:NAD(P)-binding domain-containing protein [Streptomyces chengmaiensis]
MGHADAVVIGGGQSGLATTHALVRAGLKPAVLEASERAAGSWPRYYDSLTLFSPARFSALPGMPFGGDPDRYPHRDEVVDYLTAYAARLQADIRTGRRVITVRADGAGFTVELEGGGQLWARVVVAASGSFGRPHRPRPAGPGDLHRPGPACGRLPRPGSVRRAAGGGGRGGELRGADRRRAGPR